MQCQCIVKEMENARKRATASVKQIYENRLRSRHTTGGFFYALILILVGKRANNRKRLFPSFALQNSISKTGSGLRLSYRDILFQNEIGGKPPQFTSVRHKYNRNEYYWQDIGIPYYLYGKKEPSAIKINEVQTALLFIP